MLYSPSLRGFFDPLHPAVPSDAAPIPDAMYQELLAAQGAGARIEPDADGMPVAVFPPPPTGAELLAAERAQMKVSRFQARAAMMSAPSVADPEDDGRTLLDDVTAAVATADALTQLAWAEAVEWRRTSPTIAALGGALGLTDEQLDDLFRAAALIEA